MLEILINELLRACVAVVVDGISVGVGVGVGVIAHARTAKPRCDTMFIQNLAGAACRQENALAFPGGIVCLSALSLASARANEL